MNTIEFSAAIAPTTIEPVAELRSKLTKGAVSKFLTWTSTRYNSYCDYGTKKQNVEIVLAALKEGHYNNQKTFTIECAGPQGENPQLSRGYRAWRTKTAGEHYLIDYENKTICAKYSKRKIIFQ